MGRVKMCVMSKYECVKINRMISDEFLRGIFQTIFPYTWQTPELSMQLVRVKR